MATIIEKIIEDMDNLSSLEKDITEKISEFFYEDQNPVETVYMYQTWYTKAITIIDKVLPSRLQEFKDLYETQKNIKIDDLTVITYSISDFLSTLTVTQHGKHQLNYSSIAMMKFLKQRAILASAKDLLKSSLYDMRGFIQAEFHDNELSKSRTLLKNGYQRSAGVIAGVVLEEHLGNVCKNNNIQISKKDPTLAEYGGLLKENNVIDVPKWRRIQHLADLRNKCAHKKASDPTKDEVLDLIDGVNQTIKTVF